MSGGARSAVIGKAWLVVSKSFFGLQQGPIAGRDQKAGIYWSQAHMLAFDRLGFAVTSRAPLTVFTGADGSGRTTLLRELVARKRAEMPIALLDVSALLAGDPVAAVLKAFGQTPPDGPPHDAAAAYEGFLDAALAAGPPPVLVIDDADRLSETTLPRVSRFAADDAIGPVRQKLIIAGSPELFGWLYDRLPDVVGPTFELTEMSETDTTGYIRQFLPAHDIDRDIFDAEALADIHRRSGGLPRRINAICDRCLETATERGMTRIDRATVRRAVIMLGFREGPAGAKEDVASALPPLDPSDPPRLGTSAALTRAPGKWPAPEPASPAPYLLVGAIPDRAAGAAPRREIWVGMGFVAAGFLTGVLAVFLLSPFAASIWAEIAHFVDFR